MTTATRWLRALVDAHGTRVAIEEPPPGPTGAAAGAIVTYAELDARVASVAGGLRSLGVGRGDRVASFVPNGILPVEVLLAAARLGAVTVGVNSRYRVDDLRHLLERTRPRVLVSAEAFLDIDYPAIVAGALDGLVPRPAVVWPGDVDELRRASPVVDDAATDHDLLVAFTTSGTTGRPKLAAHDHATTIRHLDAASRALAVGPESAALLTVPFCGTFGFVTLLSVLAGGGRVVVPARFEPAPAAALVEQHSVTHVNGSDDMLLPMLDAGSDLSSWRRGVYAEFAGRGVEAVAAAARVGARITGVYGSSETFALLAMQRADDDVEARAQNGGRLVDDAMEARAVDPATGMVLAAGEQGELQLRGPSVLACYLVDDGTAPAPLTDDGWFPTGDLGVVDHDGGFVYVARLGDALRLAGFLTDPAEIEQRLVQHPAVTGAQVVGTPSSRGGDAAVAFVTLVPDGADGVDEAELLRHCREGLANYKVPARVIVVDEFPTVAGANGVKIRKTELRERAATLEV
ncbi:MAG TPA: AMP-binding protein [Acidimicrobiia bacterium]|nr:AMP-binding protein [Acidimicrobiia bacterium]